MPTTRLTQGACAGTLTCETRHLALITGTRVFRRRRRLSVDVVLFLTGWEAEDAAAAHGDESPPPNDYYIVNDTPTVREFPVEPGIGVHVVVNPDGTTNPDGYELPLADWIAAITGPAAPLYLADAYGSLSPGRTTPSRRSRLSGSRESRPSDVRGLSVPTGVRVEPRWPRGPRRPAPPRTRRP